MDISRGRKRRSWGVFKTFPDDEEDVEDPRRRSPQRGSKPLPRKRSVSAKKPKLKKPGDSSRKTKRSDSADDAAENKKPRVTVKVAGETFKPGRVYLYTEGHLTGDIWVSSKVSNHNVLPESIP
jgi:hypothetical protein